MNKKLWIIILLMFFILNACTTNGKESNQNLGNEPPQPKLTADGKRIRIYQSSYCWSTKCVDYISPNEMLKDKDKDRIFKNATIRIQFEGKQPTELVLTKYNQDEIAQETITDNEFNVSSTEGIYYYSLSANWLIDKENRIGEGDSSYAFAIEVN
ncbi:hypothetical protein ACE3MQ_05820 [Paenibacillus lentus]|uniref:hypothetical protein n=1 Tax=Paenibacillus lentus TaxID=1338368 RepID=UPI00365718BD